MTKTLKIVVKLDEGTEVSKAGNLPFHHIAGFVLGDEAFQAFGSRSLIERESRRFSTSILVMIASISCPFFKTSLGCLMRRDQEISNVNQAIYAIFNFDEGAKVRQVSHPSVDPTANLVTLIQSLPGLS